MATSNVSIANKALSALGAQRIESLSQDHPNARSISNIFESARDALLRRYKWNFAITRASIAADANDPVFGNWKRYTLPGDFLRLIRDDESGRRLDWKIERGYILATDAAPLEVRYVARIEDPTLFDALFVEVLAMKLALEACEEITGSTQKKTVLMEDLKRAMQDARQANAYEVDAEQPLEDDWVLARL